MSGRCPIGFNPVQVMEILNISDHYVALMMRTVGCPGSGNNARRLPSTKFSRSTPQSNEVGLRSGTLRRARLGRPCLVR
jgi:hypothetical protein